MNEPQRISIQFAVLAWLISVIALVALYSGSFQNKPAGDDFAPPLAEIVRGNAEGPLVFFKQSAQPHNYRPLQSLLMWAFGSRSSDMSEQLIWIRALHLLCMAAYLAAAAIWLKRLPVQRAGFVAAMALMTVHPVLAGGVGGVDGFSGPLAIAIMWLGALATIVWIDRLAILIPILVLCFLIGGTLKEYAFGLGPLAVWGALVFSQNHRWRNAFIVGFTLVCTLGALMFVRSYTIPPGLEGGLSYITISPANWIKNIVLLTVALLFMGNTAWVMLRNDTTAHAVVAVSMMAMFVMIGLGLLWRWHTAAQPTQDGSTTDSGGDKPTAQRWSVYLLGSMPLAAAAPILTERVSEMYAIGAMLPLAMLFGFAVDGWLRQGAAVRCVGLVCVVGALGCAAVSSHAKIMLMKEVGDKADAQLQSMLDALPPDLHDETIAVVFRFSDVAHQPKYSVFVMNDYILTSQPWALQWKAPQRRLMIKPMVVDDWAPINLPDFRYVLLWRPDDLAFELQR